MVYKMSVTSGKHSRFFIMFDILLALVAIFFSCRSKDSLSSSTRDAVLRKLFACKYSLDYKYKDYSNLERHQMGICYIHINKRNQHKLIVIFISTYVGEHYCQWIINRDHGERVVRLTFRSFLFR